MRGHLLDTLDLGASRGDRPLFSGLTVSVSAGGLLHVTGGNGSGKTTLLRTLAGLSRPDAGVIRWRGTPTAALGDEYRAYLSFVGHHDGVQGELSAVENLRTEICLNTDATVDLAPALTRLGLAVLGGLPAKYFSQGQRRRLALARLLAVKRPLWILDEPFTALDAATCRLLETLLQEHLAGGGIVVLSSHQAFALAGVELQRLDLDALRATQLDAEYFSRAAAPVLPS